MRSAHFAYAVATVLAVTVLPSMATAAVAAESVIAAREIPAPVGVSGLVASDPSISADGRWVAFVGQVDGVSALYRHDATLDVTEQVDTPFGVQGADAFADPSISADGKKIAYTLHIDPDGSPGSEPSSQVYLTVVERDDTRLVSGTSEWEPGNGDSSEPEISDDGRYVAFTTRATDIINKPRWGAGSAPGSDVVLAEQVDEGFLVTLLSPEQAGADFSAPSLNVDGSLIAFVREKSDVLLAERPVGRWSDATVRQVGQGYDPALSADGSSLAMTRGDVPSATYVRALSSDTELQADVDDRGVPLRGDSSAPRVSSDGAEALFAHAKPGGSGSNLILRDVSSGTTQVIAEQVDTSAGFDLSADGDSVVHVRSQRLVLVDRGGLPAPVIEAPLALWNPLLFRAATAAHGPGYVLQVEPAGWEPVRATRIDRQWLRDGRVIPGATGLSYEITPADIGRQLAVRERLVVPGVPTGEVVSRAYHVKPDRSVMKAPKKLRQARGKKVVLRVRVAHRPGGESYFGGSVAPQGEVRVRLGKKSTVSTVGRRGWVRLVLPAQRPGKYHVRVTHRGTRFAVHAPAKKISLVVRSSR